LNLVLVDIGAGTSDVAITKNGSVIAYGMVPLAGDEITEAISQKFLLDFNVAEEIKRLASAGKGAVFADILGTTYDLSADEIITPILDNVQNLANAIAKQIIELNGESPQAVMLVGGGSMTPRLQQFVADALAMPLSRVAVRQPEKVEGIESIPMPLCSPDAVTPLGILKIASINTLHFLSVYVNDEEYSLFNFRELTVSDALLNAGIQLRKFNGRPGLGLMVTVDGDKKFFPGTMGTLAQITIDGEPADLDTPIKNDSRIVILPGENGTFPEVRLSDVVEEQQVFMIVINGKERELTPQITVNGEASDPDRLLKDGDVIEIKEPKTLGEVLRRAGYPPTGRRIRYMLNGKNAVYNCTPEIFLNDEMASLSAPINEGDSIDYTANDEPKLGAVLGISERDATITIYYNQSECKIPSATVELIMNGRQSGPSTILEEGAEIRYLRAERAVTTVSDALLAVNFQPPAATSRLKFKLLVNKRPAEFTDPVNNGDSLEVILTPIENSPPRSAEAAPPPAATRRPRSAERPIPSIPGLQEAIGAYRGETAPGRSPFSNFIKTNSTSETTDEPAANTAPENQPHKPSISDFIRH